MHGTRYYIVADRELRSAAVTLANAAAAKTDDLKRQRAYVEKELRSSSLMGSIRRYGECSVVADIQDELNVWVVFSDKAAAAAYAKERGMI